MDARMAFQDLFSCFVSAFFLTIIPNFLPFYPLPISLLFPPSPRGTLRSSDLNAPFMIYPCLAPSDFYFTVVFGKGKKIRLLGSGRIFSKDLKTHVFRG